MKMHFLGHYVGISKQLEALLWTLVGICYTIFDTSLFHLKDDLFKVWSLNLDPIIFSDKAQVFMKYLISGIVLIRTLSVHIYLAMYIVMLWPIIFEDRPGLILPWLTVGAVRNIVTVLLSLTTGTYICLMYFFAKLICFEFLLAQLIEHGPSLYMWVCILSYYKDLKLHCRKEAEDNELEEIIKRRRRTRSLMRKLCFYDPNIDRHLVSISTIENVVNQITSTLHRPNTRSLDSLLTNLAAEAEQDELLNLEHIKNIEEENDLSIQEKTKIMLNLTESEIEAARSSKNTRSLMLMSEIIKSSKSKEISLKTFINIYNPKSEISVQNRVQSDPAILRYTRNAKPTTSVIQSETELRTITMSTTEESSSLYYNCNSKLENVKSESCNDRVIVNNNTENEIANINQLENNNKAPHVANNSRSKENFKENEKKELKFNDNVQINTLVAYLEKPTTDGDLWSNEDNFLNPNDPSIETLRKDQFITNNDNNTNEYFSQNVDKITKTITQQMLLDGSNIQTENLGVNCQKLIETPTITVYTVIKNGPDQSPDPIPSNITTDNTVSATENSEGTLTFANEDVNAFAKRLCTRLAMNQNDDPSYTSLELSYDSTCSELNSASTINQELPSTEIKAENAITQTDTQETIEINKEADYSSLIQLQVIIPDEIPSVKFDIDPESPKETLKFDIDPEQPKDTLDTEKKETVRIKKKSIVKKKSCQNPENSVKKTAQAKNKDVGQRQPPRSSIRYPKGEKYHRDGYTLEYMRKLTMKSTDFNTATTSLENDDNKK